MSEIHNFRGLTRLWVGIPDTVSLVRYCHTWTKMHIKTYYKCTWIHRHACIFSHMYKHIPAYICTCTKHLQYLKKERGSKKRAKLNASFVCSQSGTCYNRSFVRTTQVTHQIRYESVYLVLQTTLTSCSQRKLVFARVANYNDRIHVKLYRTVSI